MRRFSMLAAAVTATIGVATVGIIRIALRSSPPAIAPRAETQPSIAQVAEARPAPPHETVPSPEPAGVEGLDLLRITSDDAGLIAPTTGGTARLTLDGDLQRTTRALLALHHLPEAAVVLMDVATGRLLVYASHVDQGTPRDICAEALAPSASVFKIVTAAALIEDAHLGPDTKQCYSGGEQRIKSSDLIDDPKRDRWCTTLAGAMGRSINTVFARLATQHLSPPQLEAMARRFGYGQTMAFDVPVQTSGIRVPSDPLEFARTAAGFWNTTLSPIEATEMSAIVARQGETVRPSIVDRVMAANGVVLWSASPSTFSHRAIERDTAEQLAAMMEHTVNEGTSWHAFHDGRGRAFLPGLPVAGKTGTLTDAEAHRFYTWFTGFAPARAESGLGQVAIAVLVVNGPAWQVKANVVARDVLRAYFASKDAAGVTRPALTTIARHRSSH
ncbi:MAG: penicillin-binding transpeptidase domain-containing protein [Polyangiaceae bacterium]|jgi:cell division protein FtsI/penicillin-binding protein 2